MMRLRTLILLVGLLCLSAIPALAAGTDGVRPDDFAYGLNLVPEASGGLNSLPLPDAVYDALTRADYGDLRVFDSAGKAVAHTLHRPDPAPPSEVWTTVARFPVTAPFPAADGGSHIRIETRADGSIVEIRPAVSASTAAQKPDRISHHILDLSALKTPVDRVRIAFDNAHTGLVDIRIEKSEDLARWRSVGKAAVVGNLNFSGLRLQRSEVTLPRGEYAYLRLSWPTPLPAGVVTDVAVRRPPRQQPFPRAELTLSPLKTVKSEGRTFIHYTAAGHRPIDRIRVDLPSPGTLARMAVFSRPHEDAGWRRRHTGMVYRLTQNEVELTGDPVSIQATGDRYWRLEILSDPALLPGMPGLTLGWRPHHLVFAASGAGSFQLAYGSTHVTSPNSHLDDLLRALKDEDAVTDLPLAKAGEPYVLGGERRLAAGSDAWKRYLLWGGMILAVGLIGGLALRLYGQVKQADSEDGSDAG